MSAPVIFTLGQAPWFIHAHLFAVLIALILGIAVLLKRKGNRSHKVMSWMWVVLMMFTAGISFAIQARGHFSLIHLLSVVVLISIPVGVTHIRRGRANAHRITMFSVFAGLVIAGAFTLLPYRMLGQLVFAR